MTYDQYIKNPMGGSVVTNRQVLMDMYRQKWNNILVRENGQINYSIYKGADDFYVHLKIPSEVVPKFYYDTIARFYIDKHKTAGTLPANLNTYEVQFYSNDPSFVYTFTHAFVKNKMFIKDLESKMVKAAIEKKAVEKNPRDEIGYVKSLVFMYFAIRQFNLFQKSQYDIKAQPYSKDVWKSVEHAEDKIKERQEKGNAIAREEHRREHIRQSQNKTRVTNPIAKAFSSPNKKNFGHFKKTDYNKGFNKIKNGPLKFVESIKKPSK